MHVAATPERQDAQWLHGQLRGLALLCRCGAWLLAVIGFCRALRLAHSALVLGHVPWSGSLALSLLLTLGLTFGVGAVLLFAARSLEQQPERVRFLVASVLAVGAALALGTGVGGWIVSSASGGLVWGVGAWIGAGGGVAAAGRAISLWRKPHQRAGALAWWALAAGWAALWVPMGSGWVGAGVVAGITCGGLWTMWRARAVGWSVGTACVVLFVDLLRGRESTFWVIAAAFCTFVVASLLLAAPNVPNVPNAPNAHDKLDSEDEVITFQSIPLSVGLLLLSVVGVALWCWATNTPWLWQGIFWPWRI